MTVGCRIADTDGQNRRRIGLAYGVFATALAALLCAQAGAARAGDDTAAQESLTDKFWKTLGLKNPGETEYEINYSERSPLVVPPNRNLPPPTSGAAPVANWPKDPDLARRKASKDDDKPVIRNYDSVIESGRALTPEELNRVSRDPKHVAAPGTPEQSTPDTGPKKSFWSFDWLNPNKEQYATFTGEPPRVSLTDPPPGYMTPSPDQPYGIVPEHKTYKPKPLAERADPVR
jgi:hypothetical protein